MHLEAGGKDPCWEALEQQKEKEEDEESRPAGILENILLSLSLSFKRIKWKTKLHFLKAAARNAYIKSKPEITSNLSEKRPLILGNSWD